MFNRASEEYFEERDYLEDLCLVAYNFCFIVVRIFHALKVLLVHCLCNSAYQLRIYIAVIVLVDVKLDKRNKSTVCVSSCHCSLRMLLFTNYAV